MNVLKILFKNLWFLFIFNIFLSFIVFLVFSTEYSFVHYINALFYITMLYSIWWLTLFIIKGGFFDGISYSFKTFNAAVFKKRDYLKQMDDLERGPSKKLNKSFYYYIRFSSLSLLAVLLVLFIVYYLM